MTKSELIDAIASRGELTKARAELVVNCVFDSMTEALQRGEGIEIRGFGSFTVRPYKPYSGRNPRTGAPVPVPAKKLPFFKVGKELKELVNLSRKHAITDGTSGGDDDVDEDDEAYDDHEDGADSGDGVDAKLTGPARTSEGLDGAPPRARGSAAIAAASLDAGDEG